MLTQTVQRISTPGSGWAHSPCSTQGLWSKPGCCSPGQEPASAAAGLGTSQAGSDFNYCRNSCCSRRHGWSQSLLQELLELKEELACRPTAQLYGVIQAQDSHYVRSSFSKVHRPEQRFISTTSSVSTGTIASKNIVLKIQEASCNFKGVQQHPVPHKLTATPTVPLNDISAWVYRQKCWAPTGFLTFLLNATHDRPDVCPSISSFCSDFTRNFLLWLCTM